MMQYFLSMFGPYVAVETRRALNRSIRYLLPGLLAANIMQSAFLRPSVALAVEPDDAIADDGPGHQNPPGLLLTPERAAALAWDRKQTGLPANPRRTLLEERFEGAKNAAKEQQLEHQRPAASLDIISLRTDFVGPVTLHPASSDAAGLPMALPTVAALPSLSSGNSQGLTVGSLTLSLPLDLSGKERARTHALLDTAAARQWDVHQGRHRVHLEAALAVVRLAREQRILGLYQKHLRNATDRQKEILNYVEQGVEYDLTAIKQEIGEIEQSCLEREGRRARAGTTLSFLVFGKGDSTSAAEDFKDVTRRGQWMADQLALMAIPTDIEAVRPDLLAAQAVSRASRAQESEARRSHLPQAALSIVAAQRDRGLPSRSDYMAQVRVSVPLDFLTPNTARVRRAGAAASREEAEAQEQLLLEQARGDVARSQQEARWLTRRFEQELIVLKRAEELVQQTRSRFDQGVEGRDGLTPRSLLWADAEKKAIVAEFNLTETYYDFVERMYLFKCLTGQPITE